MAGLDDGIEHQRLIAAGRFADHPAWGIEGGGQGLTTGESPIARRPDCPRPERGGHPAPGIPLRRNIPALIQGQQTIAKSAATASKAPYPVFTKVTCATSIPPPRKPPSQYIR